MAEEKIHVSVKEVDMEEDQEMNTDTDNVALVSPSSEGSKVIVNEHPDNMEPSLPSTEEDSNSGSTTPTPTRDGSAAAPETLVSPDQMDGTSEREKTPEPSEKALGKRKAANFEEVRYILEHIITLSFRLFEVFERLSSQTSCILS